MLSLIGSLLFTTVAVQPGEYEAQSAQKPMTPQAQHASLIDFMDAKVGLLASFEERLDAAEDGDVAEQPMADVVDVVMSKSGEVRLVALSVGGILGIGDKIVLVPSSRLAPFRSPVGTSSELVCSLNMTEQELEKLPEFDPDSADSDGLGMKIKAVEAAFPRPAAGGTAREASAGRMEHFLLASTVIGLDVHGTDDTFGEISDCAINLRNRSIDYLVVSYGETLGMGGDQCLVPLSAAQLTRKDDDSTEHVVKLPKNVERLSAAPKFESNERGFVTPADCEQADNFFGVKDAKEMDGEPVEKAEVKRQERTRNSG